VPFIVRLKVKELGPPVNGGFFAEGSAGRKEIQQYFEFFALEFPV
jgi:hypothetical protein